MLEVQGLTANYGKHRALAGVSMRVKPGEIVVILGANGAGKSTLLKAIAGICEGQVSGEASIGGEALLGLAAHKVVENGIALVPEGRGVFGDLTVHENLMLGANPKRARDEADAALDRILRLFPKLEARADQTVRTMSGGEQQMVAIGRAMMSNPEILMLDEPSLGLSPLLSKELFASLAVVRKAGLGILLVEQNARLSLKIADRGYLLENGTILREGSAAELSSDPAVQAAYLGGASGQAAPKPGTTPTITPQSAAPVSVSPRAKPLRSISANELSGIDIGALVSDAARKAVRPTTPARNSSVSQSQVHAAAVKSGRMQDAVDAIEAAARRAQSGPRGDIAPMRGTTRPHSQPPATTASPSNSGDATQRPEGAPRPKPGGHVEVWRRRPGTSHFDRKEG